MENKEGIQAEKNLLSPGLPESKTVENHWAESDWFQTWLKLARREYHGCVPGSRPKK